MNLEQLRAMGLVAPNPLLKKELKIRYRPLLPQDQWASPEVPEREEEFVEGVVTVFLRKLSAADQMLVHKDSPTGLDFLYTIIHRCVFTESGERLFPTREDAEQVDLVLFTPLIDELTGLIGGAGKKSPLKTSSGANSPSLSVDEASKSGNSTSARKSMASGSSSEPNTDLSIQV